MSDRQAAIAEIESRIKVMVEVIEEEGISPTLDMHQQFVDFLVRHLSDNALDVLEAEIAAGRSDALFDSITTTLKKAGSA